MRSKHQPELPKKDLFALGQLLQSPWTIFHLFWWRSFHRRFSNSILSSYWNYVSYSPFRACLVSLLKQIVVQIDFQRFRQIQESNSKYQSVSRELVVHSMHCTQFNCFQYFINFPSIPFNLSFSPISAATHICHLICTHVFWCQKRLPKIAFLRQYFLAA